jgi:hypothetical protein
MNTKVYRQKLRELPRKQWETYLLAESGLPGPRANLALAEAVADEGDEAFFRHLLTFDADHAPTNIPAEFLALCGTVGFGRLLAEGHRAALKTLRQCANDPRWRIREGVALGLQRLGDSDMEALIGYMQEWSAGNLLEQRAGAAALCEPRLLKDPAQVAQVLDVLDKITESMSHVQNRRDDSFQALRKGLAYCWSVAVAASPKPGKSFMEKWLTSTDKDIRWIMKENLKKDRLKRMDAGWVEKALKRLG